MSETPPLQLDAVVKAIHALRPRNRAAREQVAKALRISARSNRSGTPSRDTDVPPMKKSWNRPVVRHIDGDRRGEYDKPSDARQNVVRRIRLFPQPPEPRTPAPDWVSKSPAMQATVRGALCVPDPLFPVRTVRGVLKALLATPNPDARVDVDKAITVLAEAKPVAQWPQRMGLNLARGTLVLIDAGPGLDSVRADVGALVQSLRTVIGPDRLVLTTFAGWPPEIPSRRAASKSEATLALPASGTPILIVSDFGLSVPCATPSIWERFGRAIRAGGCEPIGLVPFPPEAWDPRLERAFTFVHWERETSARSVRRARQFVHPASRSKSIDETRRETASQLDELTKALAPATRIDRALLRRMRRTVLPGSSPALEAKFWLGDAVNSRGELAVTWNLPAVRRWRDVLRAEGFKLDDRRHEVLAEVRQEASTLQRLEEKLIALQISRPDDWGHQVSESLKDVIRSLIQRSPRESMDIARWALHAFYEIGLEIPAEAEETAKALLFAASVRAGRPPDRQAPVQLTGEVIPWITAAFSEQPSSSSSSMVVEVNFSDSGLKFGGLRPGDDGAVFAINDTQLPAVALTWCQADPKSAPSSVWTSIHNSTVDLPSSTSESKPMAATILAQNGERWRIEDADETDALVPLRVFFLEAEEDSMDVSGRVEARLKSLAGLHHAVPIAVCSRRMQNRANTHERSLWRAIQTELLAQASFVVVTMTPSLTSPSWSWDTLSNIETKLKQSPLMRQRVLLFNPEGDRLIRDYDKLVGEFPWLRNIEQINTEDIPFETAIDQLADRLISLWRESNSLAEQPSITASRNISLPPDITGFANVLQALALAFHVRAFTPQPREETYRSFFGINLLPQAGQKVQRVSPDDSRPPDDLAFVDFEHVRFQCEYVFKSHAVPYLSGRADPFEADKVFADELLGVIADAKHGKSASYKVTNLFDAFARLARPSEMFAFIAEFGELNSFEDWLRNPATATIPRGVADVNFSPNRFVSLLRRFTASAYGWPRYSYASIATSRTFPEYIEALTGLLVYYLRSAAKNAPKSMLVCNYPIDARDLRLVREAFPSSFVTTEQLAPAHVRADSLVLRLPNAADLVGRLSDVVVQGMRSEAARRLSSRQRLVVQAREVAVEPPPSKPPRADPKVKKRRLRKKRAKSGQARATTTSAKADRTSPKPNRRPGPSKSSRKNSSISVAEPPPSASDSRSRKSTKRLSKKSRKKSLSRRLKM